jgi:hypothetical protein
VRIVLVVLAPLLFAGDNQADEMREVPLKCEEVLGNAQAYFSAHGFKSGFLPSGELKLYPEQHALEASGDRISLSRFRISKYVRQGQLSPFRIYSDFWFQGSLILAPLSGACRVTLSFMFGAYEWSPILIVDGFGERFASNGRLEKQYLTAISDQLSKVKPSRE